MVKDKLLGYQAFKVVLLLAVGVSSFVVNESIAHTASKGNSLKQPSITTHFGAPFRLKVGQTARLRSENFRIKFLKVAEDSRCPLGARCFWAGQVTILLRISKRDSSPGDFELTLVAPYRGFELKTLNGYSITLLSVVGGPMLGQIIRFSNYIATLVVSKP